VAKARILAVDDQRYFRELVADLLADLGYEAETVASAEDALARLSQSSFDLVLTDLVMPGIDGSELVRRIKAQKPEQDVIVATGVVDVRSAVEAMRLGAADYLLKPFDAETLGSAIETVLRSSRLRQEHARLLEENLEYLGERSLFERAIALFSAADLTTLCDRLLEGLSLETEAQGAIAWLCSESSAPGDLARSAVRGLVRADAEAEVLHASELPEPCKDPALRSFAQSWGRGVAGARQALFLPLRRSGELIALVRLSDKRDGGSFDAVDQSCAEKLAHFGELALASALRIRALESQLRREPARTAATQAFWNESLRHELERSRRNGRRLSLLAVATDFPAGAANGARDPANARQILIERLRELLRAGDLACVNESGATLMMLPETDALGVSILRQRIRRDLPTTAAWQRLAPAMRPRLRTAAVSFPIDGQTAEELLERLERALERDRGNPVRVLGLDRCDFASSLEILLDEGETERPELAPELLRFVLRERARRPIDAGVLYVSAGRTLGPALVEALAELPEDASETELIVLGDERAASPVRADARGAPPLPNVEPSFLLRLGEAPPYALIVGDRIDGDGQRFFHTGERAIVEHLVFQLQDELARLQPGHA
jgi:FixJ family two-component response regulator